MRLAVSRCLLAASFTVLAGLLSVNTAWAQPGAVQSWLKINSTSLAPLGATLHDADEFGDAVAYLGDLDGAGPSVAALAVGAIGDDDGGNHFGAVYILFLNAAGTVISYQKISATRGGFTGTLLTEDEFGSSLAWLGDIDGTGPSVGALAVGTVGDDTGGDAHGAVYVLLLNAAGSVLSTQKITSVQVGVPADLLHNGEEFGGAVAGLGDLDGAGPSKVALAVGAIGDNDGGFHRGCAFIVYLNSSGAFLSSTKISDTAGNFTAVMKDNDNFGEDIANLGDLDGAGPGVRTIGVTAVDDDDGGNDSGAAYLIHLNANGTANSWSKISRTTGGWAGCPLDTLDNFGTGIVGLGDLDGSGPSTYTLAVSAGSDNGAGLNRGAIYLLFLNAAGSVLSYQEISSVSGGTISSALENDDEFGSALTALGDIDGAGGSAQVLIAGVGYDDDGGLQRGAAYELFLQGQTSGNAPVVTAPATASVAENSALTVNVTASDPNGDAITTLTATNVPSGATFTSSADHKSGTLSWTPSYSQSGVYTVTFTASNALSGSSSTQITVTNVDRAPTVTAPATASVAENAALTVNVTASDPDGQTITSLTATNVPSGATFTSSADHKSGTLSW
ncbi:MAG TPA: putative Ig domain-containing protein, partial [Methylomirabilota bacterium]|nr:putative Ig domain-containing protein [Methylomirabilota bacterium]